MKENNNIVLICDHTLIAEGLKCFCDKYPAFKLYETFRSINSIKSSDFNIDISLVLVCPYCNFVNTEEQEKVIDKLGTIFPEGKILLTEDILNEEDQIDLIKSGAIGFLQKNISPKNLERAFISVLKNELWISRKINEKLISNLMSGQDKIKGFPKTANFFKLSRREVEILQAISSGLTNLEISEKLFISEKTVKAHVYNLYKKMGVRSRTQALKKALDFHII